MEHRRNGTDHEEEKNTETILQAILDMHSQVGLEDDRADQENDER